MPLFGREPERKRLAELVDGLLHRGGAVLVRGETGIGKSALVAELGAVATADRGGGQPLALTELPDTVLGRGGAHTMLPAGLPVTTRLERAFTARVAGLPIDERDPRMVAISAYVAPFQRGKAVVASLRVGVATPR